MGLSQIFQTLSLGQGSDPIPPYRMGLVGFARVDPTQRTRYMRFFIYQSLLTKPHLSSLLRHLFLTRSFFFQLHLEIENSFVDFSFILRCFLRSLRAYLMRLINSLLLICILSDNTFVDSNFVCLIDQS